MLSTLPVSPSDPGYRELQAQVQEHETFMDVLRSLDAYLEAQRKTEAEKQKEKEQQRLEEDKKKRLMDLRLRSQVLQARVNLGSQEAQKELALVQNELFLLLLFG